MSDGFEFRECLHLWWGPWSSKPVGGLKKAVSGFDSHTLPLCRLVELLVILASIGRHEWFPNCHGWFGAKVKGHLQARDCCRWRALGVPPVDSVHCYHGRGVYGSWDIL